MDEPTTATNPDSVWPEFRDAVRASEATLDPALIDEMLLAVRGRFARSEMILNPSTAMAALIGIDLTITTRDDPYMTVLLHVVLVAVVEGRM